MESKRWIRAAILAASSAALPPGVLRAQVPPAGPAAAAAESPANPQALVNADLAALNQQLMGSAPATPGEPVQQQRDEAARRMLSRGSAAGLQILLDALANPGQPQDAVARREARLATARAIAGSVDPDPSFLTPLSNLVGTDPSTSDAAALALARYATVAAAQARLITTAQNPALPPAIRRGAIRALGGVVSRDSADVLIALLNDTRLPPLLTSAAADSLTDLTGLAFGRNGPAWRQWQAANANLAPVNWKAAVETTRAQRQVNLNRANSEFIADLMQMQAEIYQRSDKNGKGLILMRYLNSPVPQARVMGAKLLKEEQEAANPTPAQSNKRLEELVGDSDPTVRLNVALAINSVNDTDALDAILTQLLQETVTECKIAQIDALVPMRKLRAVPILRLLLRDGTLQVATRAAEALQKLGSLLIKEDPTAAGAMADELWQLGKQRSAEAGGGDFRRAAIEAVGPLHHRRLATEMLALRNDPDPRVRSAGLRALADLGNRDTFFQISQWLAGENSAAVRLDAIDALAATGTFEDASATLNRYMRSNTEPDKAVQERAWFQFQSLLGRANDVQVLNRWAADFQNDAYHRLPVLLKLNEKLQANMQWEDLAAARQNTGVTYMELRDPARAAIQFSQALDYWQKRQVPNPVTVTLIKQLLQALLASKDYAKVRDFAAKQIAMSPQNQDLLGRDIKDEVNRLYDVGVNDKDPQKLRDALSLIDNAMKIQPALAQRYQDDLLQFQKQIQQALPK